MKKSLVILLSLVFVISMSLSAFAASDHSNNGNGKGNGNNGNGNEKALANSSIKKEFKLELNTEKKEIAKQKSSLEKEKELLEAEYEALLAAGDSEGAAAILISIEEIDSQISDFQAQIKEINNERFMVIKTMYSDEELAQFENAAALIEQMYIDAEALGAGSVIVKNNLIKFEAPPYIKGGKTLVPLRAITEELGAEVVWDPETQSVTVSRDGIDVVITINDTIVYVDGVETEVDVPAEATCGRTYVPLRFLAEVFGLEVDWDAENQEIDIEDPEDDSIGDPEAETGDVEEGTGDTEDNSGESGDESGAESENEGTPAEGEETTTE